MFLGTPTLSGTSPIPELTEHPKSQDTSGCGPFHVPHSICTSDLLTGSWVPWGRKRGWWWWAQELLTYPMHFTVQGHGSPRQEGKVLGLIPPLQT